MSIKASRTRPPRRTLRKSENSAFPLFGDHPLIERFLIALIRALYDETMDGIQRATRDAVKADVLRLFAHGVED